MSSTSASTPDQGPEHEAVRWSRTAGAAPGQVLADGGQIGAGLPAAVSWCQDWVMTGHRCVVGRRGWRSLSVDRRNR